MGPVQSAQFFSWSSSPKQALLPPVSIITSGCSRCGVFAVRERDKKSVTAFKLLPKGFSPGVHLSTGNWEPEQSPQTMCRSDLLGKWLS